MHKPHVDLNFEAGEWRALQRMAEKYQTDVGSILRIAAVAILEAERTGKFAVVREANPTASPLKLV
jgi:hypothetical protein